MAKQDQELSGEEWIATRAVHKVVEELKREKHWTHWTKGSGQNKFKPRL